VWDGTPHVFVDRDLSSLPEGDPCRLDAELPAEQPAPDPDERLLGLDDRTRLEPDVGPPAADLDGDDRIADAELDPKLFVFLQEELVDLGVFLGKEPLEGLDERDLDPEPCEDVCKFRPDRSAPDDCHGLWEHGKIEGVVARDDRAAVRRELGELGRCRPRREDDPGALEDGGRAVSLPDLDLVGADEQPLPFHDLDAGLLARGADRPRQTQDEAALVRHELRPLPGSPGPEQLGAREEELGRYAAPVGARSAERVLLDEEDRLAAERGGGERRGMSGRSAADDDKVLYHGRRPPSPER
jgi:hypothetical protein